MRNGDAGIRLGRANNFHNRDNEARNAWAEWQRHVDAGRIRERPQTNRKILARHARG